MTTVDLLVTCQVPRSSTAINQEHLHSHAQTQENICDCAHEAINRTCNMRQHAAMFIWAKDESSDHSKSILPPGKQLSRNTMTKGDSALRKML